MIIIKKTSKKLFCFFAIIMCALLFVGCQPAASDISSNSGSGSSAPVAEIKPWQHIFHDVASANLDNAQQVQVRGFTIYKYPGFGEIMVGRYCEIPLV